VIFVGVDLAEHNDPWTTKTLIDSGIFELVRDGAHELPSVSYAMNTFAAN
jgi:hypothetical protein